MRVIDRSLALALCLGLLWLPGCDDGGGGDPTADMAGDEGPETDMTVEPEPDAAEPEPDPDMGEPEPDMDPDMGEPEPDMDPDMGEPEPDMAPPCEAGETRACAVPDAEGCVGSQTCTDGEFGPCAAPAEVCDGEDTDCNGAVDDVPGAGEACTNGAGACAADGVTSCGPDGELVCDAQPGDPSDEICGSGADEDCDGESDEPDCINICAGDGDCDEGELCIDESCVPGDCREDGACEDGELCIDNGCRPGNCREDAECADGEICADFGCMPRPAACEDPQFVEAAGVFEGSTDGAPSQIGASCGGGASSPEAAFLVDLGVDGPVCLSTLGSAYDTVLFVQSRCGDPASEAACNDDVGGGPLQSQIQLASGAEPVYVFVDGFSANNSGEFVFTVSEGDCPCLDDDACADGEACRAGACAPIVCGDGAREGEEGCDDGDIEAGDGCDADCAVEEGYVCLPTDAGPDRCRLEVCAGDDDCFDDEVCVDEACIVGDCRDDEGCAAGELCLDNTCAPGNCRENADCADGQICDANLCVAAPDEGAVRLVDGEGEHVGRVEIFFEGTWGTVCDDAFGDIDAEVVCRELGYPGAVRNIQRFGGGEEPTWLDEVACVGDEARLADCPANPLGDENCSHDEDVGVECLRACAGDGDCFDGERCAEGVCRTPVDEICDNGVDDDLDGAADCDDDGCFEDAACPCPRDDIFEDDSDALPGPVLPAARLEGLALCDDDIYRFELCDGGTTVVTIEFDHAAGNIDAELGNGSIEEIVAGGFSETDDEVLVYTNDTGMPAEMDIFLNQGATGTVYAIGIEVFDCEPGAEICKNAGDDDGDGLVDCEDPDCVEHPACEPPASACEAPIPLPGVGLYAGDTTGGPAVFQETDPDCAGFSPAASAEAVYAFAPEADGQFCFSTLGSTFDTVLYVRADACEDPEAEVVCNDDNGPIAGGTRSALTLDALGGTTYFVFVDGYGAANDGPYELRVTEGPCAAPVEICDNGINDDLDPLIDCEDADCFGSEICLDLNCGNGSVDPGEACDDGGRAPDDGCDAGCLIEPGYDCEQPDPDGPSVCRVVGCGDGIIDDPETCDDENLENGDGCDALCTAEVYIALRGIEQLVVAFPEDAADSIRFVADAASTHVVARTGDGAGGCIGDTTLGLFPIGPDGELGERIAVNDDGGDNGLCSLIDAVVEPGAYAIVVGGFQGDSLTDVVVDLRVAGVIAADAPGDYDGDVPLDGGDLFELTLDRAATVTFETGDGLGGCPGDSVLTLFGFDAEGEPVQLATNDDANGLCSRIAIDLGAGRYDLEAFELSRDAPLTYVLSVDIIYPECGNDVPEVAEDCDDGNTDAGDGCDAVCTFESYDALLGIERFDLAFGADGADVVRFTVDHDPSRLIARTSDGAGGCPGDTVIDIFPIGPDGRGLAVGGNDDGGNNGLCSLADELLPPGDYELEVRGFNGVALAGVVLDYRLEVDVDDGGAYDGAIPVGGTDLYVFDLDEPAEVTLTTGDGLGGCPGDTRMFLFGFDEDGERLEIVRNDDAIGLCSQIVVGLEPGRFEIEVEEFSRDEALAAYVLQVDGIGPPPVDAVEVAIRDFAMAPDPLVIPVGTTVRWTNFDGAVHTVTSGLPGDPLAGAIFDSGNMGQGETFEYTFQSVGEFLYFCRPHSAFMRDYTVIVEGEADPALGACEESCADLNGCFGTPNDQDCIDGCMSNPDNQATGQCIAEGLDPANGECNPVVIGACG